MFILIDVLLIYHVYDHAVERVQHNATQWFLRISCQLFDSNVRKDK